MATYVKINDWVEYMVEGANIGSDQFAVALTNTAPGAESTPPTGAGDGILANVTQISYTNLSGRNLTTAASTASGGTHTLDFDDLTLTASGGPVGPFRYIYIYDDTVAGDPLVMYYDRGDSITLQDGEDMLIQFDAGGFFTVA